MLIRRDQRINKRGELKISDRLKIKIHPGKLTKILTFKIGERIKRLNSKLFTSEPSPLPRPPIQVTEITPKCDEAAKNFQPGPSHASITGPDSKRAKITG